MAWQFRPSVTVTLYMVLYQNSLTNHQNSFTIAWPHDSSFPATKCGDLEHRRDMKIVR